MCFCYQEVLKNFKIIILRIIEEKRIGGKSKFDIKNKSNIGGNSNVNLKNK